MSLYVEAWEAGEPAAFLNKEIFGNSILQFFHSQLVNSQCCLSHLLSDKDLETYDCLFLHS